VSNPWDSETSGSDIDPTSRSRSIDKDVIPQRIYGWGVGLLALAIVGHLSIPWLLWKIVGKYRSLGQVYFLNALVFVYEMLGAFFIGLWIAQYVAIWLWLHGYVSSRARRWMTGLFLSLSISYAAMVGLSLAWGPPPIESFLMCFLGGAGVYALLGLVLGILLRSSKFVWKPRASTAGSKYSLKTLLGAMVGSALLMIAIKSFPFDGRGSEEPIAQQVSLLSIWLAWLAVAISILTWLQLGTVFSLRRRRFRVCFLVVMLLGPAFFHAIGLWLLSWGERFSGYYSFEELAIAYAIEIGLVAGVGLVICLLPGSSPVNSEDSPDAATPSEDVGDVDGV